MGVLSVKSCVATHTAKHQPITGTVQAAMMAAHKTPGGIVPCRASNANVGAAARTAAIAINATTVMVNPGD